MPEVTLTSELSPLDDADIFADDGRETMIKVDHVTMEFNMASEQLNSLKEYAIAIAKRKLYFEKFTALDDISFEVKKGDVFGILGTNGSGKSTLLKIIAGVLEPTKGSCEINGNIAPLIELGAGFDMELSARENIFLNGSLLGYSKTFIEEHFSDIVEFAEIEKFLDMPMKNYSSGMIARIAFAIATVIVPEILIVDEVLSVGDFMFQQKCENRINDLIENHGVTVLIVSHSNDQIERLCNKAIWIEKGHTRIMGDATKVCNAYRVLGGRTGSAESEAIVYHALQNAEQIHSTSNIKIVGGENHYDLSRNIMQYGWNSKPEAIIFVPDNAHVYSIIATGIAGAYNAPIIPFRSEKPYDKILDILEQCRTSKPYILCNADIVDEIKSCINQETVNKLEFIPIEKSFIGRRCDLLDYGIVNHLWKNSTAFFASFANDLEAFSIAPLAYEMQCPFLILYDSEEVLDEKTIALMKKAGIKNLIPVDHTAECKLQNDPALKDFHISLANKVGTIIGSTEFVASHPTFEKESLFIGSGGKAQWVNLISIPSYAGYARIPLLLFDNTDLDNVAESLDFCHKKQPKTITIFGKKAFSNIEMNMIANSSVE